jgi:type VI secretion system ImpA/VasJ family protein
LLLHLEELPPVTSGRQTAIPAPAQNIVKQLETLLEKQNWAMLLEEAESALGANRMWLDIHRYVAMALGGLGHEAARKAVIDAIADILTRLPELRELQFNSGLPLANAATQSWFDDEVVKSGGGQGGGDGLTDEERGKIAEARSFAGGGKISEAVEILEEVCRAARSVSVSFRARLATAQACVVGGSSEVADGLYTALYKQIDEYRLEQWDPDLVAGCYKEHYEVLKSMAEKASESRTRDPSLMERMSEVYARLCRVSPATALKLGS